MAILCVAARNRTVADAQSRGVSDAHSLRLELRADARSVRLSARSVRRTRDHRRRRTLRETNKVGRPAAPNSNTLRTRPLGLALAEYHADHLVDLCRTERMFTGLTRQNVPWRLHLFLGFCALALLSGCADRVWKPEWHRGLPGSPPNQPPIPSQESLRPTLTECVKAHDPDHIADIADGGDYATVGVFASSRAGLVERCMAYQGWVNLPAYSLGT